MGADGLTNGSTSWAAAAVVAVAMEFVASSVPAPWSNRGVKKTNMAAKIAFISTFAADQSETDRESIQNRKNLHHYSLSDKTFLLPI